MSVSRLSQLTDCEGDHVALLAALALATTGTAENHGHVVVLAHAELS